MSECLFCDLAVGNGEVSMVAEDERTATFMDIRPVVTGHVLVVPKAHATYLADLDPEDGAQLFRVGQQAAAALRSSDLRCDGVNLFLADGVVAGQEVFHVHLHVIPRHSGDGFDLTLPEDYGIRPRSDLDATARSLRTAWGPGRHLSDG